MFQVLCVVKKLANFVGSDVVGIATQLSRQLQRTIVLQNYTADTVILYTYTIRWYARQVYT